MSARYLLRRLLQTLPTAAGILRPMLAAGIKVFGCNQMDSDLADAFLKATSDEVG